MSEPIRSGYVNWIDGMKMSRTHFLELQQAVEDRIRDERGRAAYHTDFGLLPGRYNGKPSLDYEITFDGRAKFTLRLRQCRAITAGGDRIEILHGQDTDAPGLVRTVEIDDALMLEGHEFDLLVQIDSLNMEPYGVPNVQESPPRHPFVRPKCSLEWVSTKELRPEGYALNQLIIARLRVSRNELTHDGEFMPPCVSMASLPRLEEFHAQYYRFLKEAEQNLFKIVIRLNMRDKRTDLSDSVDTYCRAAIGFLERELGAFQVQGKRMTPREVVANAASFARTLRYAIELLTGKGKDEMLNYINTVIAVVPGDYIQTMSRLTDLEYEHTNLKEALMRVLEFCRVNRKLLDEWVRLDYIGQRKNEDIFIHEESTRYVPPPPAPAPKAAPPPPPPPAPKRGWSF